MAYYSKKDISDYIGLSCEKITNEKHTPITDPQKALKELTDEQDLVGFFWLEVSSSDVAGTSGVGINMPGKVFVRLNSETYTDDRFAVDSYHAAKEGISVTDIIKKREEEQKNAATQMSPEILDNLKNLLSNK